MPSESENDPLIPDVAPDGGGEYTGVGHNVGHEWHGEKIDIHLLPPVTIILLLSFLVRMNISNAFVAGMKESLGMSDKQYSTVITTLLVPYILGMTPASLMFKKVGAHTFLPGVTILSGIITLLHGFVTQLWMLLVLRALLGLVQGGLIPCITLYISDFYPKHMLQLRIAIFFSCAAFAGAISGLVSAAILKMNGIQGIPGWGWLFILEGLFTIVFGIWSHRLIPKDLMAADFLTYTERKMLVETLRHDKSETEASGHTKMADFIAVLKKPHVIFFSFITLFGGTIETGLGLFEPLVVRGLGFDGILAQIMSSPPFLAGCLLSILTGRLSDKYRARGITVIFCSTLCLVGFLLFLVPNIPIRYCSLFFSVSGTFASVPAIAAWASNNISPYNHRAIALSFLSVNSTLGGFISAWILGTLSKPPEYRVGTIVFAILSAGEVLSAVCTLVYFVRRNRERTFADNRRLDGEDEDVVLRGDEDINFVYTL